MFDFDLLLAIIQEPSLGAAGEVPPGYSLLELIVTALGSIGAAIITWITGYLTYKRVVGEKKAEKEVSEREVFDILIMENKRCEEYSEKLKIEIASLKNFCDENRKELLQIQNEVYVMRQKLEFYEKNNLASDARDMLSKVLNANEKPMWIHSVSSDSKWYLNDSYCALFNIKRPNFWTPVNILARYPSEYCIEYVQNDLKVVHSNLTQVVEEKVKREILNPLSEPFYILKVRKTPLVINENTYILGEVLSIEELKSQ